MLKSYEGIWSKIKYVIKLKNNNAGYSDEKCMKIRRNLDDDLGLQTLKMYVARIAIMSDF